MVDSCPAIRKCHARDQRAGCLKACAPAVTLPLTLITGNSDGVENRRAQHIMQGSRFCILRNFPGEVSAFFLARREFIDRECRDRHIERKDRRCAALGNAHRAANRTIDQDVVVPEACQRSGAIHQNAQFRICRHRSRSSCRAAAPRRPAGSADSAGAG